jgi:hypothetical protein
LIGFLGNFGCATDRNILIKPHPTNDVGTIKCFSLKTPIPPLLVPFFNRIQLYVTLMYGSIIFLYHLLVSDIVLTVGS